MNILKKIINFYNSWKERRMLKKRLKELRERDPFIYK